MDPDGLTFRLLGHGIAYSASPAMMSAAFAELGLLRQRLAMRIAELTFKGPRKLAA